MPAEAVYSLTAVPAERPAAIELLIVACGAEPELEHRDRVSVVRSCFPGRISCQARASVVVIDLNPERFTCCSNVRSFVATSGEGQKR